MRWKFAVCVFTDFTLLTNPLTVGTMRSHLPRERRCTEISSPPDFANLSCFGYSDARRWSVLRMFRLARVNALQLRDRSSPIQILFARPVRLEFNRSRTAVVKFGTAYSGCAWKSATALCVSSSWRMFTSTSGNFLAFSGSRANRRFWRSTRFSSTARFNLRRHRQAP